jgi:hypothetical protein
MTSFFIPFSPKVYRAEALRRLLCFAENSYQGLTPSDKKSGRISSNFDSRRKLMRLNRTDSSLFVVFAQHPRPFLSGPQHGIG